MCPLRQRLEGEIRLLVELEELGDGRLHQCLGASGCEDAIFPNDLEGSPPEGVLVVHPEDELGSIPDAQLRVSAELGVPWLELERVHGFVKNVVLFDEDAGAQLHMQGEIAKRMDREGAAADPVSLLEDGDVDDDAGSFGICPQVIRRR